MNNSTDRHKFLDCSLFPNEIWKCDVLFGLRIFTSTLSFIGSIVALFFVFIFKKYRLYSQRLILYLILSAFVSSIFYLANRSHPNQITCNFLGFTLTYVSWLTCIWILLLTINILMSVRSMLTGSIGLGSREEKEKYFVAFCWLFPLIPAVLPFAEKNSHGPAGPWCWIVSAPWRFAVWFVPWILILIVLVVIYTYSVIIIYRRGNTWEGFNDSGINAEGRKNFVRDNIKQLIGFPLVFILSTVFALINRCNDAVHPTKPEFALYILMTLTSPLKGFGYSIAFTLACLEMDDLKWRRIKLAILNWNASTPGFSDYQVSDPTRLSSTDVPSSNPRVSTIAMEQRATNNGGHYAMENDDDDGGVWTDKPLA